MLASDLQAMLNSENLVVIAAIGLTSFVAVVGIIGGTLSAIFKTRARELTKRELAAYVAEGTVDPKDAIAMLNSDPPGCKDK